MADNDNKCFGCAVRLHVGAHTFTHEDKEWHCACLLRYLDSSLKLVEERYDALREQQSTMANALIEALDRWGVWVAAIDAAFATPTGAKLYAPPSEEFRAAERARNAELRELVKP